MAWLDHMAFDAPFSAEAEAEILPILAPPCAGCEHWKPKREYLRCTVVGHEDKVFYEGVRVCHAYDMHSDFSCFDPKGAPNV